MSSPTFMSAAGPSSPHEHRAPNNFETFFSYGFRPFFLFGAIYAVTAMGLFLFWIGIHHAGGDILHMTISMAPFQWHAHEMLFGFAMAVICGFFLTAVPNWTGTHAVHGWPLALLTATWLAGRIGVGFSAYLPPAVVAIADLLLVPFLSVLVVRAMLGKMSKRNFVFFPILALLFASNLAFHLEQLGLLDDGAAFSQRIGLWTIILLIAIIGGRVVPAFTTNALRNRGITDLPVNHAALNILGIFSVLCVLIAAVVAPESPGTGWIAVTAAVLNGLRLAQWKGHRTVDTPILWVLHLGFAWLVAGLFLFGAALLWLNISPATALHALTAGAIGTMTLGVMSRAALGHTGRPLDVSGLTVLSYILMSAGAAGRVITPIWFPELYSQGMLVSGVCWIAAFAIFVVVYWPILTGPRISKPA